MTDKAWTTTALDSNKTDPTRPRKRTELEILQAAQASFRTHPRNTPKQQQAEIPEGGWGNSDLQR